ncbi:hypothetical protein ACFLRN_07110 [Thermoproteota archaeon]
MKNSRDLALVIMLAVLSFVFMTLIGQVPQLITGIPGIGYAFTIVYSITQTVGWLLFEGRRWRIFGLGSLFSLISLSLIQTWTLPVAMATIVNSLIVDLIFNSLHESFERKNRLIWWVILAQGYYWATHSIWLLFLSLPFYPLEQILGNWFIPIMLVMLPVVIIEAIAGGFIGYKIFRRVEKVF